MYGSRLLLSSVCLKSVSASQRGNCFHLGHESVQDSLKQIGKPEKISKEFWKKILWVAVDLKEAVRKNNKMSMNLLETNHVTLLFGKPHGRFELSFTLACDLLGVKKTVYLDPYFGNLPCPGDSIRVLSELTDMFITHGLQHEVLDKIVETSSRPIYSASCNSYCFQKGLSDIMTYLERFHYLKNLTLAWIGPPLSIFNSYLFLCSCFGININYTCICIYGSGKMSPVHRFKKVTGGNLNENNKNTMKEFKNAKDAIKNAHIISTAQHPEVKNQITLEEADPNWVFMHSMPRSEKEVTDDVFYHEKNLSWKTSENYLYVAMAVILISLKEYTPKIKMPDFDGEERKEKN